MIFLHGNNDTPFPTACNPLYGKLHAFAESFLARGYAPSELWGSATRATSAISSRTPTNRSGEAHSTVANVPDLRRFVHAVLAYTGGRQVGIVGHSLGGTLARAWLQEDRAWHLVRRLVSIASPHHGIVDYGPLALGNYFALAALGAHRQRGVPRVRRRGHVISCSGSTAAARRSAACGTSRSGNGDADFVYISAQDGPFFPPVPAIDRSGAAHDFLGQPVPPRRDEHRPDGPGRVRRPRLRHLGIANSPTVWDLRCGLPPRVPARPERRRRLSDVTCRTTLVLLQHKRCRLYDPRCRAQGTTSRSTSAIP